MTQWIEGSQCREPGCFRTSSPGGYCLRHQRDDQVAVPGAYGIHRYPDFTDEQCREALASISGVLCDCDGAVVPDDPRGYADALRQHLDNLRTANDSQEQIRRERDEYKFTFDLRWRADRRAVDRWRAAALDRDLIIPDHADLCVWLLAQLEAINLHTANGWQDRLQQSEAAEAIAKRNSETLPEGLWRWTWDPACYTLRRHSGDPAAQVWTNGTWHTWDLCGVGGENASEPDVEAAMREALASVVAQGFAVTPEPCSHCDGSGQDPDPEPGSEFEP